MWPIVVEPTPRVTDALVLPRRRGKTIGAVPIAKIASVYARPCLRQPTKLLVARLVMGSPKPHQPL